MPNTKARLKPPIDFLVRTEPLYNAWLPLVSSSLSNVISQIGVFVLVRIESRYGFPRKKERREREKIDDDERCVISTYTNINAQSFRRRRQRRSHRRGSGRDGAFRAVRFIREYRNLESLWWEEKRDEICDWERRVCIQISKSFHFWLKERLLVLSSAMKVQRERKKVCSSERRKHTLRRSLSLSLCVCVLLPRSSLCVVSARSFSLFSLNLITKERMERKMKRERRSAILPFVLKPYTLNSFFLQM